jgi:ketosteroid isomerase-like protein
MTVKTNNKQVADEILTAERGSLEHWNRGDIDGCVGFYADDVSYFDPLTEKRVDGHPAVAKYLHDLYEGKVHIDRYEIIDPQVIVDHDLAVLTYNLKNHVRDGANEKPGAPWNATIVYQRTGGSWRQVHIQWGFTRHPAVIHTVLG